MKHLLLAWLVAACCPVALAEVPSLFGEEIVVPQKQVRLKLMLVRVPMKEASELLLQDDRHADYWDLALPPLLASGKAVMMEKAAQEALPQKEMGQEFPQKQKLTAYSAIALAGDPPLLEDADLPHGPTGDFRRHLRKHAQVDDLITGGTVELGAGLRWRAKVARPSAAVAETEWDVEWVDPVLERREIGPWPAVQGHKPEHIARRSVGLNARKLVMPWSRAVLLGVQTEPGRGEALHTGHVIFMLGRAERGEGAESTTPPDELASDEPSLVESLWIMTLPAKEYLAWSLTRTSVLEDETAFRQWMSREGSDGIKLEAVMAGSGVCESGGRREWGTARYFRHSLDTDSLLPIPSDQLQLEWMEHLMSITDGSIRCEWPSRPLQWSRVPVGYAADGSRNHLDLPATSMERFEYWGTAQRDAPEMLRAWYAGEGQVRVCFARRVPVSAAEQRKHPPQAIYNAWCIDTPAEGWAEKMEHLSEDGQAALAEEVLAAVRSGAATLADCMTCTTTFGYVASEGQAGQGFITWDGPIHVKPKRDAFRLVPSELAEDAAFTEWSCDWQQDASLIQHSTRINPRTAPWRVGLPQAPKVELHTTLLDRSSAQVAAILDPDETCVLAACLTPHSTPGPRTVRWWLARQSPLSPVNQPKREPRRYLHAWVADAKGQTQDRAALLLPHLLEANVSRGLEVPYLDALEKDQDAVQGMEFGNVMRFNSVWRPEQQVVGFALKASGWKWTCTRDVAPYQVVKHFFEVEGEPAGRYEMSFERPLMQPPQTDMGDLPKPGKTTTVISVSQENLYIRVSE